MTSELMPAPAISVVPAGKTALVGPLSCEMLLPCAAVAEPAPIPGSTEAAPTLSYPVRS